MTSSTGSAVGRQLELEIAIGIAIGLEAAGFGIVLYNAAGPDAEVDDSVTRAME